MRKMNKRIGLLCSADRYKLFGYTRVAPCDTRSRRDRTRGADRAQMGGVRGAARSRSTRPIWSKRHEPPFHKNSGAKPGFLHSGSAGRGRHVDPRGVLGPCMLVFAYTILLLGFGIVLLDPWK